MRCKNCGFENEDARYICSNCGSPLYDEDEIAENEIDDGGSYNNYNNTDYNNGADNSGSDGDNKKQIITVIIAVIVVVAVAAGIIFGAVSGKKNKETTTESTSISTTAEETTKKATTTKKETTSKETTTEETTTKETTTKPTTTTEKTFRVYVDIDGNGNITGDGEYAQGKKAVLTAAADEGFEFDGWYDAGGNLVASGAKYTITVKSDITLTAKFRQTDGGVQ